MTDTPRLVIEVPLPDRVLSSNGSHGHWSSQAKARKEYRLDACVASMEAVQNAKWWPPEQARVSLTYCTKGARGTGLYAPRDPSNCVSAWKAGFDGLTDAGVIRDDSSKHMTLGAVTIDSKRGPFVEVLIEALE